MKEKLDLLKKLYDNGLSVKEVAAKLQISPGSINHAMQRHNILRRKSHLTKKIQFLRSPLSYKPKNDLSAEEEKLKIAGLMLYWAEGAKRNSKGIDFANSDQSMILLFMKFLRTIYQVNEQRLRVYLYTHQGLSTKKLIEFWSNLTKIPKTQFSKPYINTTSNQVHDKMPYGLVHIRYADTRLLKQILTDIEQVKS
jgi:hypothetical protein